MPRPQEIELKFEVPPGAAGRVDRLPVLKGVKPDKAQTLVSVYYDTDKQTLRKCGLSLRVRRQHGRYVQTIKQNNGASAGIFKRNEWECDVDGIEPDLDAARGTALEPLLDKKLRRKLKPLFQTRVRRRIYPIRRGDSQIEFTVDKGKVEAAGHSSPLCEVELELKQGEPDELFKIAQAMGDALPVSVASKSKAAHGYELVDGEQPGAVKGEPVELSPDANWAMAFKVIAMTCLHQIAANQPALRRHDPEAVHQMRVGLRRMRAAISLFKVMLAGPQTEAMKEQFKWLTNELGPARELDVFIKRVVKRADGSRANKMGQSAVAKGFRARRIQAFDRAVQAAASPRFRRLMLDAAAWIEVGDWTHTEDELIRALRERTVRDAAAEELRRRRKKIRKRGAQLADLDPLKRHKLRIQAKKLRYATEFFAGVFPGRKSARRREKFGTQLRKLQDTLGDLNDIVVHQGLAKQAIGRSGAARKRRPRFVPTAFAAGRLSGGEAARFASVMKEAEHRYAGFAKCRPFWT
jgi:triphosphatase